VIVVAIKIACQSLLILLEVLQKLHLTHRVSSTDSHIQEEGSEDVDESHHASNFADQVCTRNRRDGVYIQLTSIGSLRSFYWRPT